MKSLKISLITIGIFIMLFGIYKWHESITPPTVPMPSKNQFILKIEEEIQELSKLPDSKFSKDQYNEINYLISEYHKEGRLGQNQLENDQEKENLSKRLYSTYADNFINQAFYVFNESKWKNNDLSLIKNEFQNLQKSQYLEKSSPVDLQLSEIRSILYQYEIIVNFINSVENFKFNETSLTARFPHQEVLELINQSIRFRRSGLGNSYLNNNVELRKQMEGIPNTLFFSHVEYLDNKIDAWTGMFTNYKTQKVYADNLYFPIKKEIEELNNDAYNSPNFNNEYLRLKRKWDVDSNRAYEYFQ